MAKKRKKHHGDGYGAAGYAPQYGMPPWQQGAAGGAWPHPGMDPAMAAGMAQGMDAGLLQGLPAFLRSRNTEQFLLGALLGAAAAWVLSDEELRGKLVKSAMNMYAGVAGSFEEMKEQMADLKAEVEAERHGDA